MTYPAAPNGAVLRVSPALPGTLVLIALSSRVSRYHTRRGYPACQSQSGCDVPLAHLVLGVPCQ